MDNNNNKQDHVYLHFSQLSNKSKDIIYNEIFDSLIEELIAEIAIDIHREIYFGKYSRSPISSNFTCLCPLEELDSEQQLYDILGQKLGIPLNQTFPCVNCGRSVVSSRYAPHLEKCMGFGRNSSRIANRRIAKYSSQEKIDLPHKRSRILYEEDDEEEEYED